MMTVKQVFEMGLKMAVKADIRGQKGVKEYLSVVKKEYESLKSKDKEYFNKGLLDNPYADSQIHVDDSKASIKRVMVGIDIGPGEVLVASQLGERGKPIDLVIAHHPIGFGLASLHTVMELQVEVLAKAGVPVHVAEKIMEERIKEVGRGVHPANHERAVDIAKLLKINLMNTHTITDNLVTDFLTKYINKRKPRLVGDLIDVLLEIPEYQEARKRGVGPRIFTGNKRHRVGKHTVEMTGGTSPSDKVYKEMSRHGISTVIGMHIRDKAMEKASEHYLNVVIAGHGASDSLGMNLFLDELEKKGIEIVPCSGMIRVSRVKKKGSKK